ncbi:MAG TPA: hypothetical protein VKZ84_07335 [Bacteriovoracaceae bacterium]|nr:hypothetical protein [Bacteriovoracaceae bacterium]
MNKLIISTLLVTFALTTYAQKADLLLIDENIDASSLEKDFNIHKGSKLKSFLPDKAERDRFLKLVPESTSWEEYQKDAFFMDIKKKSVDEIHRKYPHFSKDKISRLKGKM